MKYKNCKQGIFVSRPNRFLATVLLDGQEVICHVKNTGRCKELFIPGATVFLQESDNPARKTKYDLISVYKENRCINLDSQAPNRVFRKWAPTLFPTLKSIQPEKTYKNSRFDFYIETKEEKRIFVEVKGVTLERNGVALFPDAPTERGIKHIRELCACMNDGYEAYLVFVVQMSDIQYFTPNRDTHSDFADALVQAEKCGVKILCVDCNVTADTLQIKDFVKVVL